jgi:ankyrin repeat protein
MKNVSKALVLLFLCSPVWGQKENCDEEGNLLATPAIKESVELSSGLSKKVYKDRQTANLFEAIAEQNLKKAKKALKHGANPNAIKDTAAFISVSSFAVRYGTPEILRAILEAGGDPNLVDANLQTTTPLMQAAKWDRPDFVDVLLDPKFNTDINKPADGGRNALHMAATRQNYKVIERLVQNPKIDLNAESVFVKGNGDTAFSALCARGQVDGMKAMLSHPGTTKPLTLAHIQAAESSMSQSMSEEGKKLIKDYKEKYYPSGR